MQGSLFEPRSDWEYSAKGSRPSYRARGSIGEGCKQMRCIGRMRCLGAVLIAAGALAAGTAVGARAAPAAAGDQPLTAADFEQAAPRGFGDQNNSWAQSMVWWKNALYVGTARQAVCTSFFALWNYARVVIDQEFADTFLAYPPSDPDLSCEPEGADLSLQAEIWRWVPGSANWQRVFQSPLELDNPGPGPPEPPLPGKKLPYEISIRGLEPHTEPDGTEALYAFGVNSTVMWDSTVLPPPRILRTTDGLNFEPLPQTPGTFLGDLPHNPDHSSFRSPESFNGKLFVISGPIFGQGSLIASADPAQGDDAWFLASPPEMRFYEMEAFNGWLYLGTLDLFNGYSIVKTRAEGTPPYEFVTVVPSGAGILDGPSRSAVSLREYKGRLYVGTATKTEVVRINPDDTWELVVGPPREIEQPGGERELKVPISGLDAGFGLSLNDHAWQMLEFEGSLYIGTYNVSTWYRNHSVYGPAVQNSLGAHLYRTDDGWYFTPVTTDGFADRADPFGGRFDYGIRTMAATPYGAFFGTANDFHGLAIFRAESGSDAGSDSEVPSVCDCLFEPTSDFRPDPPERLDVETGASGLPLVSWRAPRAARSQVWRTPVSPARFRESLNYFGQGFNIFNGTFDLISDALIGPYEPIAVVEHCSVEVDDRVLRTTEKFLARSTLSSADTLIVAPAQRVDPARERILRTAGLVPGSRRREGRGSRDVLVRRRDRPARGPVSVLRGRGGVPQRLGAFESGELSAHVPTEHLRPAPERSGAPPRPGHRKHHRRPGPGGPCPRGELPNRRGHRGTRAAGGRS
jgi:hypothetical protein